jgi:hypothetical protein
VVESLPSKHEAISSNPNTAKRGTKRRRRGKGRGRRRRGERKDDEFVIM